jgi:hypothetical protein
LCHSEVAERVNATDGAVWSTVNIDGQRLPWSTLLIPNLASGNPGQTYAQTCNTHQAAMRLAALAVVQLSSGVVPALGRRRPITKYDTCTYSRHAT